MYDLVIVQNSLCIQHDKEFLKQLGKFPVLFVSTADDLSGYIVPYNNLDEYLLHYSIDSSYDCLKVKKKYLDLLGCCNEQIGSRELSEENLCRRLESAGIICLKRENRYYLRYLDLYRDNFFDWFMEFVPG